MHADKLPITGPCPIDLDAIGFDRGSRVSHCDHCVKSVHNLSNMTRTEAKAWMHENRGEKVCVSYSRTEDGAIRFAPEPAVVPLARLRRRPSRSAGLAAALTVTAALAACTPHGEAPPKTDTVTVQAGQSQIEQHVSNTPPPPRPAEIPMAGAAVVPEIMVDGEMEVPDPEVVDVDTPCDKTPTQVETPQEKTPSPVPTPTVETPSTLDAMHARGGLRLPMEPPV